MVLFVHPLSLERLSLEHCGDREPEAVLLPEDLVEVIVVANTRVVNHAVSDLGKLLRQEAVGRGDDIVQVRRDLHKGERQAKAGRRKP